jgi:mono/diheme cytochrome c family protein
MNKAKPTLKAATLLWLLAACSTAHAADPLEGRELVEPATGQAAPEALAGEYPPEQVEQGRYLVGLLGCGNCHTDGALAGKPNPARLLAGSATGIARSDPTSVSYPGVVFPANLTPDDETGIGKWSLEQIDTMLRSGTNRHGQRTLPVMPWPNYTQLRPEDTEAIAMYLKSLPPVKHKVPAGVQPGKKSKAPYVHFGVYRSTKKNDHGR